MNPKPFWPLNHFTVPVVIFLLQRAHMCIPRDAHAEPFQFVDVDGKGARGHIQQGTAAERTALRYTSSSILARLPPDLIASATSTEPLRASGLKLKVARRKADEPSRATS